MVFVIFGHAKMVEVLKLDHVVGSYNGRVSKILVSETEADLEFESRHSDFCGPLEHSTLAAYYGRETSLSEVSQETQKYYNAYAFQHSEESILDFESQSSSFGLTLSVVLQIFEAVSYVHSVGFLVDLLDSPSTYVFKQLKSGVSVKLLPFRCFAEESQFVGCHTKESNCRDFGLFLARFFFGSYVSIQEVLKYNPQLNEPTMRYTPVIAGKRLYSLEVIDLIEKLVSTPLLEFDPSASKAKEKSVSPLRKVRNRPFSWSWEKRVLFRLISWEWLKGLPHDHSVIDQIDKMPDFLSTIGHEWCNLPSGVLKDLRFEKARPKKRRRGKPVFRISAHVARSKGRTSGSARSKTAMKRSLRKALAYTHRKPRGAAAVKQQNTSGRGSASRNSGRGKDYSGAQKPLVRGSASRNSEREKGDSKASQPFVRGSASRNSEREKGDSKAPQPLSRGSASRNSGREKSHSKAPQLSSRGSALRNSGHEKADPRAPQPLSRGSASRNSEHEKADPRAPQQSGRGSASRNSGREKGDSKAPQLLSRGSASRNFEHEKADPRAPQPLSRGSASRNFEHEKADPRAPQPLSRGSASRNFEHEKADPRAPQPLSRGSASRNFEHEKADPRAPQPLSRESALRNSVCEKGDARAPQQSSRGSASRNSVREKGDTGAPQPSDTRNPPGSRNHRPEDSEAVVSNAPVSKKRKFEDADSASRKRRPYGVGAVELNASASSSRRPNPSDSTSGRPHGAVPVASASRSRGPNPSDSWSRRLHGADSVESNASTSSTCRLHGAVEVETNESASSSRRLHGVVPVAAASSSRTSHGAVTVGMIESASSCRKPHGVVPVASSASRTRTSHGAVTVGTNESASSSRKPHGVVPVASASRTRTSHGAVTVETNASASRSRGPHGADTVESNAAASSSHEPHGVVPEAQKPLKKLTPVSFSATEFLQKSRNFLVHGPLSEEVHGFDEYSRYDENIVRGFEFFLSAELPAYFLHVYEVLARAWSEGLVDKKCMKCFLDPSYGDDQESDG